MEKITYRKTLDVHKGGIQFTLQGFETADKMSRVIEISLMASGDAIDFPLEGIAAVMYVSTPGAETPNRIECDIKDNKIIYNVLPITEEGTTTMQLKLIETSPGASVLYSPKFAVEVSKSDGDVIDEVGSETFTLLEKTMSNAATAYNARITNFNLDSDGVIRITYGDGSEYTSDFLKRINIGDNAVLSESYAKGGTGARGNEDIDNSKYYSNVARSEALAAKNLIENSEELLSEVRKHGVYTAFSVDFSTGEVVYESPQYKFKVNTDTGELEAIGESYSIEDNLISLVQVWLKQKGIEFPDFVEIVKSDNVSVGELQNEVYDEIKPRLNKIENSFDNRVTSISLGGTGANNKEEALANLGGVDADYVDGKIEIYEYTGNGKHGKMNPCVIPYKKPPKMIIVQGERYLPGHTNAIFVHGMTRVSPFPNYGGDSGSIDWFECTWGEKSLSFYNEDSYIQLNGDGCTYRCVIFY